MVARPIHSKSGALKFDQSSCASPVQKPTTTAFHLIATHVGKSIPPAKIGVRLVFIGFCGVSLDFHD
ncbi:MAG: hypothetical protein ACI9R3_000513 [Verrucomicrobiales bacterium]|jgi:hypothetical protein